MVFRPTEQIENADALSRLPVDEAEESENNVLLIEACHLPITGDTVAQSTGKDPILSQVRQSLVTGRMSAMLNEKCKP